MQDEKNTIFQMRFPQKLWYLLNLQTEAIMWGGTGRTILLNYRVLYSYLQSGHSIFKTANISSFVRQLNLYGFRKVTSHLQDPMCNSSNPYMHEYVHDYFQFGRFELLNNITRKALALKKNSKPKSIYGITDQFPCTTPLQRARRALHVALRKAAQDLLIKNSPKQFCKLQFECDDDFCEDEDNIELSWMLSQNDKNDGDQHLPVPGNQLAIPDASTISEANENFGETSQDSLMNFNDDSCQQNNDNFASQFLNIPELGAETTGENPGGQLLAEFEIDHDMDLGITKIREKQNDHSSLNCVLPSISNDQSDDVSMAEKNHDESDYNDREWDQMLDDIIINKSSNPESSSDLKDLYSHISTTIDLLNNS